MAGGQDNALVDELLGPLQMHFLCARTAYQDYLANGKSFLFASSLRRTNAAVRALLLGKGYLLPEPLRAQAADLVRHYDVWLTLWDDLAQRTRPQLDDTFVFDNAVTYPKNAEAALRELFDDLLEGPAPAGTSGR